jgi:hypothetical protein
LSYDVTGVSSAGLRHCPPGRGDIDWYITMIVASMRMNDGGEMMGETYKRKMVQGFW